MKDCTTPAFSLTLEKLERSTRSSEGRSRGFWRAFMVAMLGLGMVNGAPNASSSSDREVVELGEVGGGEVVGELGTAILIY